MIFAFARTPEYILSDLSKMRVVYSVNLFVARINCMKRWLITEEDEMDVNHGRSAKRGHGDLHLSSPDRLPLLWTLEPKIDARYNESM